MFGKIYKRILDIARSTNQLTKIIWGIQVHRKLIKPTWDVTTLNLKKTIDETLCNKGFRYLDMGCGHIALLGQYIKRQYPDATVLSVDYYEEFADCAQFNANQNKLDIEVLQGDLFTNIGDKFDVISFNPPYKPEENNDIEYKNTVYSGHDGLDVTRRFLNDAKNYLTEDGKIFLGINCYFVSEEACLQVIKEAGYKVERKFQRLLNTSRVFVVHVA